jgi:uncharacterized membrane protein YuzA (DUF378 family)
MNPKGKLYVVALVLVIIGALNWGLIALNGTNLVTLATTAVTSKPSKIAIAVRTVYGCVGLAALYVLYRDWPLV